MRKPIQKTLKTVATVAAGLGLLAAAWPAAAQDSQSFLPPTQTLVGSWSVTDLAAESPVKQVESFKVSRDFVAWTELDSQRQLRLLYAFDGVNVRQVAAMSRDEWDRDYGNGFFDSVEGNYDLADGLLVWTASDGLDREIWSFDGFTVRQISDNTYDDNHPVTSAGRVAWTSYPGSAYNLMVSDRHGLYRLDSWPVKNYAFSGQNLFWLNRLPNENWFRVFRNDGQATVAVGKGDDRAATKYFHADGQGTVAWEYSTHQWSYDKREVFLSYRGGLARRIIQRDVPPNVMRIEDVYDRWVILNVTDLLESSIWNRVQLIQTDGGVTKYLDRFTSPTKARSLGDGQFVRHWVPDTASALILGNGADSTSFIKNEHVVLDRFEAKDGLVAGALLKGGLLLRDPDGQVQTVTGNGQVQRLAVDGCVAWLEGNEADSGRLRSACPTVAVRNSATGASRVAGRLVKSADSPAVYLAASDGQRYLFPSEAQFYGWYADFSSVRTVPSADLAALHLAGSALLRPGSSPVKIASSPRVYTVSGDGLLRWVTSAEVMAAIYGPNWVSQIAVIPDASLADYRFGAPIEHSWQSGLAYGY